jgi:outer membrane protein assembly factor BamE (lipoprotein component of BamABCDE complex)
MKKLLISLLVLGISAPVFAINDAPKLSRKCRKHPEKCQVLTTPVQEQQMTLGIVQRDIKIGTSQTDVAMVLGSPNIVTQDADGKETWIYDKVSSITSYGSSGFGVGIGGGAGGFGSGAGGLGLVNIGHNKHGGTVQSNQKTLTVVLKFDNNHNVASFSYHMSSF